jgi:hypothetical protein
MRSSRNYLKASQRQVDSGSHFSNDDKFLQEFFQLITRYQMKAPRALKLILSTKPAPKTAPVAKAAPDSLSEVLRQADAVLARTIVSNPMPAPVQDIGVLDLIHRLQSLEQ